MTSPRQLAALSTLGLSLILLAGCGSNTSTSTNPPPPPNGEPDNCKSTHTTSPAQPAPTANVAGPAITGFVKAGQQPIANARVQLNVAGTTGNGSASQVLLIIPGIRTDANGAFTIPAGYTCPFSNSLLYAQAFVGDEGSATQPGILLAAVLGPCGAVASSSFTINEATTVATAYAMAQFLSSSYDLGATATNNSGILLAAATAASLVDPATGTLPGANFPSTGTAPTARLDTLANLLNACVVAGTSSSACTGLYAAAPTLFNGVHSSAQDTFQAAINIAQHPGTNISTLYSLSSASHAFSPALQAAPADWTLAVNFGGGGLNAPSAISIDSTGRLWVANYYSVASLFSNTGAPVLPHGIGGSGLFESFGGAVDVNDDFWVLNEESSSVNSGLGSITVVNDTGAQAIYSSGGVNFPLGISFDTSGVAWVADYGNSHVTLLSATGAPLSGTSGYSSKSLVFPVAVATDAKCNAYVANQSSNTITRVLADGSDFTDYTVGDGPSGIAIDASGNIWSANYYGDSVGLVSASGSVLSGTGYTGGGIEHPQGIAADGKGNLWVANYLSPALSQLAGVNSTATAPGTVLSPPAGWATDSGLAKAFGLAIDASGNIWITNFATNLITEFVGLAAPVQTPQLGPVRIP